MTYVKLLEGGYVREHGAVEYVRLAVRGVAIGSWYDAIRAALPAPEPMREDDPGLPRDELYVGRVRYIDSRTAEMPLGNAFWPMPAIKVASAEGARRTYNVDPAVLAGIKQTLSLSLDHPGEHVER